MLEQAQQFFDCQSGFWIDNDFYTPSDDEVVQALADADIMNYNMRTYGTIDAPKDQVTEMLQTMKWVYGKRSAEARELLELYNPVKERK